MQRVIVISNNDWLARQIDGVLSPAFEDILSQDSSCLRKGLDDAAIYIVDAMCIEPDLKAHLQRLAEAKQVIVVSESDIERIIPLISSVPEVSHFFGSFNEKNGSLFLTTVRRCLDYKTADAVSYLQPSSAISTRRMTRYSEIGEVLSVVRNAAAQTGAFSELGNIVATVTSEMVMNACFDAPIDKSTGRPKYAHLPRTTNLTLLDDETVTIKYGFDNESFLVSVTDNFGALDRKTVVDHLERCAARGPNQVRYDGGGAGIGLYMLFRYSSQLDFHICPGEKTEVIALVSLSKRLREYEMSGPCINFFVRGRP